MATSQDFVTLGEIFERSAEDEEDEELLSKVKSIIERSLPPGWRDWKVIDWSREDLLGRKTDSRVLNKIRFAIPSVELVQAFYPEATSIGEKTYKNLKIKLLDWDICRALITNPNHVAAKLRGSAAQAELFNRAVEPIRASVYSREQISDALTTDVESHLNRVIGRSRSRSTATNTKSRKRIRQISTSTDQNESSSSSEERSRKRRRRSSSSWSYSPRHTTESRLDRMEGMIQSLFDSLASKNENEKSHDNTSWRAPSPQFDLSVHKEPDNNWEIFTPSTKESEPSIPRPDSILEQQGVKC